MAKTVADVMNMVKESEVKFVDFRFTDTRGKEQHVTVPVSHFDEDKFTGGHAFDGSSIAGWKGIEASDMQLMPDPNTANIDPFFEERTLVLICAIKDLRWPGELPGMVFGTALHTALNAWYSVRWPADLPAHLDAITSEMLLRCAYLLVLSFVLVGSVSVGIALLWLLFRPEPS